MDDISCFFENKNVLFVTTKNLDYIRNRQETRIISQNAASIKIVGSNNNRYFVRLLYVYARLLTISIRQIDVVFIGFAPQLVLPFWKIKFGKKMVIIDFFISMYDTFINDRKCFSSNSAISKILKKLDRNTLRDADRIICDTNAHGRYFIEELGAESEKLITLYLEADKTIYFPQKMMRPEKLKGKFVVLYFGSILPIQGIDVVLEAYSQLKDDDRFYFYMIGPVGRNYKKPEGKNIEYIDWLPQQELADHIAIADLCLAGHFNGNIDKARRTIPGKAYIYAAMDKTMVLGDNEANRELFDEKNRRNRFVRMSDADALRNIIIEIYSEVN